MSADTEMLRSYQLRNAYTNGVKFDVQDRTRRRVSSDNSLPDEPEIPAYNAEISLKEVPSREWEPNIRGLISSKKWLLSYGLKKNKLDYNSLLADMGFKHSDDYDVVMKRPVSSRYAGDLFSRIFRPDGRTVNITADKNQLKLLEARLVQAILLYKRRLDWLTSESRRIFGVITEKCPVIVLDIRNMSPQQFDQYRSALERVLREQVTELTKFNIIRAAEDIEMYNKDCLPVTHDTVEGAVEWLWALNRLAPVSKTATCEAVAKALQDRNAEAVYLFTEGAAVDGSREILKEKINKLQLKTPVHVISYNCTDSDTIHYLKDLSKLTGAKFHAYAVTMEMDIYEGMPVNPKNSRANIVLKRKTYGGVPPGAGIREDVLLIFEELETARKNLEQVQAVLQRLPDPKFVLESKIPKYQFKGESREEYLSSEDWLKNYGLVPQKLGLFDILAGVVFRHQDGVVDVLKKPNNADQTDAVHHQKLINARYCDRFPVVKWKDGHLVHVQVSPEIQRNYEQKMKVALNKIKQRIDWLSEGSRELFGTVLEEQIYILIDTSSSMVPHLPFVKDKLFLLLQEQLRHKMKFNLVSFNSRATAWRDKLVGVTESNLQSAWSWIQGLACQGSTNTYNALQIALSDTQTQAIYLLTDGRPDQPPKAVIAQVQMLNRIPVHTISFNCNDVTANQFLCQLANATRGRFHYFNETGIDIDVPDKYESEDIHLLKEEYSEGWRNLEKVAELRDQCLSLAWKQDAEELKKSKNRPSFRQKKSLQQPNGDVQQDHSSVRPRSAPPGENQFSPMPPNRPSTTLGTFNQPTPSLSPRMYSAKFSRKPPTATHTRTSLLRTLTSSGRFSPDAWLLPETKQVLDRQADRQTKSLDLEVPDAYKKFKDIFENRGLSVIQKEGAKKRKKKSRKKNSAAVGQDLTVKQWLGKYGLIAKRLTILDALAPTIVPHKAKYVPILDKHILAKVFNNVLPLAHVSGRDSKQIQLVSPTGVNLAEYEQKLTDNINMYKRKLDQVVWDAISDEAKQDFDSEEPVSFLDNKIKLMKLLKELNWPVTAKDIALLEGEITRGEKFLQQSQDLQRVAAEHQDKNSQPKPTKTMPISTTLHSNIENSDENKDVTVDKDDENKDIDEDSEKADSVKDEDADKDEAERDLYEEQASIASHLSREQEGLREMYKQSHVGAPNKTTQGVTWMCGQKVIARKQEDGLYYSGFVVKREAGRRAAIEFEDSDKEIVLLRHIIPVSGAIPCPLLRIGDYVLVRVINTDTEEEVYIPGIVHVTPRHIEYSTKFYTILTYNNQRVSTMRSYIVKVTKPRFEFCCRYIRHKLTESREGKTESRGSQSEGIPNSAQIVNPRDQDIDDIINKLKDQEELIHEHEKDLKYQIDELARLKRKQRKMAHPKNIPAQIIHVDKNTCTDATDNADIKEVDRNPDPDQKPKISNEEDNPDIPADILALRKKLRPLTCRGEEVLARWPDDGWYYQGTLQRPENNDCYVVQDCTGCEDVIWREDIIADSDYNHHAVSTLKTSDKVVALHPDFPFSYAPATVQEPLCEGKMSLWFYDGVSAVVPLEDVESYLPPEKFQYDVDWIKKCDDDKLGQEVIARDDQSGLYYKGKILEKLGDSGQFVIQWRHGQMSSVQKTMYIFGNFTKRFTLAEGDRVLALAPNTGGVYKPGLIKDKRNHHWTVQFCDNTESRHVSAEHCYWLSQDFYDDAVLLYKAKCSPRK